MVTYRRWLCLVVLLLPMGAAAQTTPPVWAKPDHFWYRKSVPGGHLWLNVNTLHGVKEPLFDHQRLAIEMTIRTGLEFTPLTLPFADPALQFVVKYDGSNAYIQEGAMAIEFVHNGFLWRCDLQIKWDWNRVPPTDYECLSRRPFVPGQSSLSVSSDAPRVSPDGKWEAFIQNHNVALRSVGSNSGTATALSSDGTAEYAYQFGSIRWSADSKSLSAWRVNSAIWMAESVTGNVKNQVHKGQWKIPG
ncbi:MAG: hypothetical protein ACRENP_22175 [Longimicrobiales bacterium]